MTKITNIRDGLTGDDAKLDALLKHARPTPDAAREAALLDRIMAAAEKGPRLVAPQSVALQSVVTSSVAASPVEPAPQTPSASARAGAIDTLPRSVRRARTDIWAAGSLLAASLVLGVFLGQSTYSETTVRRFEQATGVVLASASQDLARSLATAEDEDE